MLFDHVQYSCVPAGHSCRLPCPQYLSSPAALGCSQPGPACRKGSRAAVQQAQQPAGFCTARAWCNSWNLQQVTCVQAVLGLHLPLALQSASDPLQNRIHRGSPHAAWHQHAGGSINPRASQHCHGDADRSLLIESRCAQSSQSVDATCNGLFHMLCRVCEAARQSAGSHGAAVCCAA